MSIDKSLFATFRIVASMVSCDGKASPEEQRWFQWLISRYDLSKEQIEILNGDFRERPNLRKIVPDLAAEDRSQLFAWLSVAMNRDGKADAVERAFWKEVQSALLEEAAIKEMLEGVERRQFFDDIREWKRAEERSRMRIWFSRRGNYPLKIFIPRLGDFPILNLIVGIPIIFIACGALVVLTKHGIEYNRNYKVREFQKPLILGRLKSLCDRMGTCENALEFFEKCADPSWIMNDDMGCGKSKYGTTCGQGKAGFRVDRLFTCLNGRAGKVIFAGKHADEFKEWTPGQATSQ